MGGRWQSLRSGCVFTVYHHVLQKETIYSNREKERDANVGKDHLVSNNRFTGLVKKLTYYKL